MNPYRPLPSPTVPSRPGLGAERGGFALITVLWLITALATLVGLSIAGIRVGNQVSTNRIVLIRGRWAAEACFAIAQTRWVQHRLADTATIDLGRGVRCHWTVQDPSTRLNLNTADPELLRGLGATETFVQALLARRRAAPIESVSQLPGLAGFDTTMVDFLTVDGPGSVNLATAPHRLLAALPGLGPEAVDRLLYARGIGHPMTSVDQLAAALSPGARAALLARYADLVRVGTFAPSQLVLVTQGWIDGESARAEIESVVVPLPDRLAVIRRRMW